MEFNKELGSKTPHHQTDLICKKPTYVGIANACRLVGDGQTPRLGHGGVDNRQYCNRTTQTNQTVPADPALASQVCRHNFKVGSSNGTTPEACQAACDAIGKCTHFSHSSEKKTCDFCTECDLDANTTTKYSSWVRPTQAPTSAPTLDPTSPAPTAVPTHAPSTAPTRYNDQLQIKNLKFESRFIDGKKKETTAKLHAALNRCMVNDNQKKLQGVQTVIQMMKHVQPNKAVPVAYRKMKEQIILGVENLVKLAQASDVFSGFSGAGLGADLLLQVGQGTDSKSESVLEAKGRQRYAAMSLIASQASVVGMSPSASPAFGAIYQLNPDDYCLPRFLLTFTLARCNCGRTRAGNVSCWTS